MRLRLLSPALLSPAVLSLGLLALAAAGPASAAPVCAPAKAAPAEVTAAVRGWFAAAETDDLAATDRLQTADFYAYDAGKRFEGHALEDLLRTTHASGVKIVWNLGEIEVHAGCDQAMASWINKGSAGKPDAMTPVTWQESSVLRYEAGHWKVAFLHSNRVP